MLQNGLNRRGGEDLIRQKSQGVLHSSLSSSNRSASLLNLQPQLSLESKCSIELPKERFGASLSLIRHLSSQCSASPLDRQATPSSGAYKRKLSILAG